MNFFNKLLITALITLSLFIPLKAKTQEIIKIKTDYGTMEFKLYKETPMHKKNFIRLIKAHFYDKLLFHRVIKDFIIQGGYKNSKNNSNTNEILGNGDLSYSISAEFNPKLFHKKGALCAARQPNNVNPNKASSASQFYIVQGRKFTKNELESLLNKRNKTRKDSISYTQKQINIYRTIGGAPHLDMDYTVYGQMYKGFDVLDSIAKVKTNSNNRPLKNIKMYIQLTSNQNITNKEINSTSKH